MQYFNAETGLLDRKVFASLDIYRREMRSIFECAWLFVGMETSVTAPGSFMTACVGEQPVVVWRGSDAQLRAFLNRCPRGEAPVCHGEGQALSIRCRCHGKDYTSDGKGLIALAGLASHRGLLFATMDDLAPPLDEYLSGIGRHFGAVLDTYVGDVDVCAGTPLRWMLDANWKLPAEAFAVSAATGHETGYQIATPSGVATFVAAIGTSDQSASGTLFPNLSFDFGSGCLQVWHPRGPGTTEVHTYCLVDRTADEAERHARQRACMFQFGPAGLAMLRYREPWRAITAEAGRFHTGRVQVRFPLGLGEEQTAGEGDMLGDPDSETCQRAFYAWWQDRLRQPTNAPSRAGRMFIGGTS